jgi:hypothetical protein
LSVIQIFSGSNHFPASLAFSSSEIGESSSFITESQQFSETNQLIGSQIFSESDQFSSFFTRD